MLSPCHTSVKPYSHYASRYLSPSERRWVDLQPFLLMRGYKLRRRFQPDWKPSWSGRMFSFDTKYEKEDYVKLMHGVVIDAIRTHDKAKVVLKRVYTGSTEISILRLLNSPKLRADPRNNIIAVFDILLAPNTDEIAYVVMPKLMNFAVIPFQFVGEVIEAFSQFLEGLLFLHSHNITHKDACFHNLMMDSSKVVPRGFHFSKISKTEENIGRNISYKSRQAVGPIQYYFIDVGMSKVYLAEERGVIGSSGRWGQDRTIPEFLEENVIHDPFKVDICQLGNVFGRIVKNYEGLSALQPLVQAMTLGNPNERPTADSAVSILSGIAKSLTSDDKGQRIYYMKCSKEDRRLLRWGLSPSALLDMDKYLFPELHSQP